MTRRRTDAGPGGSEQKAGEEEGTAIRLHLDELLGRRGMTLTELSAKVGTTIVNLSILKTAERGRSGSAPWPGCARRWDVSPVSC